jgi:hypothetical protein
VGGWWGARSWNAPLSRGLTAWRETSAQLTKALGGFSRFHFLTYFAKFFNERNNFLGYPEIQGKSISQFMLDFLTESMTCPFNLGKKLKKQRITLYSVDIDLNLCIYRINKFLCVKSFQVLSIY